MVILLGTWALPSTALAQVEDTREEERTAYLTARQLNSVDGWEIFISNYPESFYIEQARKLRDAAIVRRYCNENITLAELDEYVGEQQAHEPRIKTFYANLVNNPTHSYRYEHMDVGFNGCTGTVHEHITFADGKKDRHNEFYFDARGLLTRSVITGSKGNKMVTDYTYAYDNLHGPVLRTSQRQGRELCTYEALYDSYDKLELLLSDSGKSKYVFTYNDKGAVATITATDAAGKRTMVYNDGYIIRMEYGGKALRYYYDYDSATMKKFLIGIASPPDQEVAEKERKFNYRIDTKGRFTRVEITEDGKPQMTITRTYDN